MSTMSSCRPGAVAGRSRERGGGWSPGRILALLGLWRQRARQRRRLTRLDERMLKDIGISRVDALREAAKPFWRK